MHSTLSPRRLFGGADGISNATWGQTTSLEMLFHDLKCDLDYPERFQISFWNHALWITIVHAVDGRTGKTTDDLSWKIRYKFQKPGAGTRYRKRSNLSRNQWTYNPGQLMVGHKVGRKQVSRHLLQRTRFLTQHYLMSCHLRSCKPRSLIDRPTYNAVTRA